MTETAENHVVAERKKSTMPIIKTPDDLQKWMIALIDNPSFAQRYEGIIDRQALVLAAQYCRNNWWQLSKIKEPASIVDSVIQAGAYGWVGDGIAGHAYIVAFGDKAGEVVGPITTTSTGRVARCFSAAASR